LSDNPPRAALAVGDFIDLGSDRGEIMSSFTLADETVIQFPGLRRVRRDAVKQEQIDTLSADLQATLGREEALRGEIGNLMRRRDALAQECENRVAGGLNAIAGLLSSQSRAAVTPEAAEQLCAAARRVNALGRVHWRDSASV
jgi:two-component sensor histidine kinase